MDKLTERVRKTIKEHHMVKPGDRVMAALSGGADSVCLLRILVQLRDILGIRLRAVHVHHGLTGTAGLQRNSARSFPCLFPLFMQM